MMPHEENILIGFPFLSFPNSSSHVNPESSFSPSEKILLGAPSYLVRLLSVAPPKSPNLNDPKKVSDSCAEYFCIVAIQG